MLFKPERTALWTYVDHSSRIKNQCGNQGQLSSTELYIHSHHDQWPG